MGRAAANARYLRALALPPGARGGRQVGRGRGRGRRGPFPCFGLVDQQCSRLPGRVRGQLECVPAAGRDDENAFVGVNKSHHELIVR